MIEKEELQDDNWVSIRPIHNAPDDWAKVREKRNSTVVLTYLEISSSDDHIERSYEDIHPIELTKDLAYSNFPQNISTINESHQTFEISVSDIHLTLDFTNQGPILMGRNNLMIKVPFVHLFQNAMKDILLDHSSEFSNQQLLRTPRFK